jgi:hypothetical protein
MQRSIRPLAELTAGERDRFQVIREAILAAWRFRLRNSYAPRLSAWRLTQMIGPRHVLCWQTWSPCVRGDTYELTFT